MFSIILLSIVFASNAETIENVSQTKSWTQMMRAFNEFEDKHISNDIQFIHSLYKSSKVSKECVKSIESTLEGLEALHLYAYQMYDSWPTFPPRAILEGTVVDFGEYDQCLAIRPNAVIGAPGYCVVTLKVPTDTTQKKKKNQKKTLHTNLNHRVQHILPESLQNASFDHFFHKLAENAIFFELISVRLGICVPEMCSEEDIGVMAAKAFEGSDVRVDDIDCNTKTDKRLNVMQIIALVILFTFLFISLLATFLNTTSLKNFPKVQQMMKRFSLKQNALKLMSTDAKPDLSCIDGLRVLTMFYIITAHIIEYTDWSLYKDTFKIKDLMNDPIIMPLTKAHNVVETFFLISGLLASYTTLKHTKHSVRAFRKHSYVCQRVIRLLPLMAIFILLSTLLSLTNSGPVWNQFLANRITPCYSRWWQNLLFIHNFIDPYHMCIGSTWFLSVDMQFHLLSFVVIWSLLKSPTLGLVVNTSIICLSIFITSSLIYIMDFTPGRVSTQFGTYFMNEFLTYVYWQPWPHAPVYFIGLALGSALYRMKPIKLGPTKRAIVWTIIFGGYLTTVYDTYYWTSGERENNRWVSAVLFPATRLLWALQTSALIWMCVSGNGGLVNRFLSWTAFTPLSRLTYSVYLTHIWIVWSFWGTRRTPVDTSLSTTWLLVSYSLIFSYLLGFVFAVLFECPIEYFQQCLKRALFAPNGGSSGGVANGRTPDLEVVDYRTTTRP